MPPGEWRWHWSAGTFGERCADRRYARGRRAGVDVLAGQGANLSDANASAVSPGVPLKDGTTTSVTPCVVADPLILNVAAGNAKSGKVIIYFR